MALFPGTVLLRRFEARAALPSRLMSSSSSSLAQQPSSKRQKMIRLQASPTLSEEEQQIFKTLLEVDRKFNLGTQLRVAGGWVRDKLLGKDCHDIDIALDNMFGRDFCEKVNEYLSSIGQETRDVGTIASNPDQSKHLETATMRVNGVWLDFVNLRAETYAEHSRIPAMTFGTPKQDAERRDLTINSLFYNIKTEEVEDFTGRGIRDLASGVIATPLEPMVTFLDDPLRVLRSIRFGARFDFELTEDLKKAAASDPVRNALSFFSKKISRERIGHEIVLMLLGNGTLSAMSILLDLKLFATVFWPPSDLESPLPDNWEKACMEHIRAGVEVLRAYGVTKLTEEQKRVYLLSALFFPLKDSRYVQKRKLFPVTSFIIKESLKLKNSDIDGVIALQKAAAHFSESLDVLLSTDSSKVLPPAADTWEAFQRMRAGSLVMEIKDLWRAALLLSSLSDFSESSTWNAQEKAETCVAIEELVIKLGLERAWELKCLIDGNEIMEVLKIKGPAIKEWKDLAIQWQLAHPKGTAVECRSWLEQEHSKSLKSD